MENHVVFPGLGLELDISRVAFSIGDFNVYWYGVIIAVGFCLALVFAFANAKRFGIDSDRMVDVIIGTTICAVICARAYYVVFAPFEYQSLWDMVNLRDGGLAIYGGVLGAVLFGILFCKWRKVPVLPMLDLALAGFLLGQGIGRWGNFFNQEAFGSNTTLPWGMYSQSTHDYLASVQDTLAAQGIAVDPTMPVHPTFLYESIWCLLGFALLALYIPHRRFNGEMSLLYAVWYGAERAVVEGLRTDSLMWVPVRVSQLLAAVSAVAALVVWAVLRRKYKGIPLQVPALPGQPETDQPEKTPQPQTAPQFFAQPEVSPEAEPENLQPEQPGQAEHAEQPESQTPADQ